MLKYIIKKDLRSIIRLTAVPILAVLVLSYLFSGIYVQNINYGIVNLDHSSLSRKIVQGLENNPGLNVCYYADSAEELQQAIYAKKISAGIIIPNDYAHDIKEKRTTKAVVVADMTNLMIGNNAVGYSSAVLGTFNSGYQLRVLEGKGILPGVATKIMGNFSLVDRTLYDPQLSYLTYMIYVVIPLLLQIFYLNQYLIPILIEEKEILSRGRITWNKILRRLKLLMPRLLVIWVTTCSATIVALLLARIEFNLPVRGNLLAHFVLIMLFLISLSIMALALIAFLNSNNFHYYIEFFFIIYVLFILTSGCTWPVYMMPKGFMFVVRLLWPYCYVALPFKNLHLKGIGWQVLMPDLIHLIVFCIVWLTIVVVLNGYLIWKKNKKYMLNQ